MPPLNRGMLAGLVDPRSRWSAARQGALSAPTHTQRGSIWTARKASDKLKPEANGNGPWFRDESSLHGFEASWSDGLAMAR